jgi:hypothetical protein
MPVFRSSIAGESCAADPLSGLQGRLSVGIGPLWGLIRTAAANIPWTKVAQNTPLLVDMLGKAKAKIRQQEVSQRNIDEQLRLLQEENARLSTDLQQTSLRLRLLTSRVATLSAVSVISLLCSLAALVLWLLK